MDKYEIETHPFETFVPPKTKYLIIGTFPTVKKNFMFNFYYSGKDNFFWSFLENVFNHSFKYYNGNNAVEERKTFLISKGIGITDMHKKCYRKNNSTNDNNLFPIILNDIFSLIEKHNSIKRIVLTSRTDVFGALGLLKTYFLQKGLELEHPIKRIDKVLKGSFFLNGREIEILVPYSPSPRVFDSNNISLEEIVQMYKQCLT